VYDTFDEGLKVFASGEHPGFHSRRSKGLLWRNLSTSRCRSVWGFGFLVSGGFFLQQIKLDVLQKGAQK
jgi:hypothetical protein